MNRVRIDFEDESIKKALADCEVGEPKTITITLTPEDKGDGYIEGSLDKLAYKKPKKAEKPMAEEEEYGDEDDVAPAVKKVKIEPKEDEEM